MKSLNGSSCRIAACLVVLLAQSRAAQAAQGALAAQASYILPSSAYLTGANAAEYQTNVRVLNQGTSAVTVTATFYDQRTSTTSPASPFQIGRGARWRSITSCSRCSGGRWARRRTARSGSTPRDRFSSPRT